MTVERQEDVASFDSHGSVTEQKYEIRPYREGRIDGVRNMPVRLKKKKK